MPVATLACDFIQRTLDYRIIAIKLAGIYGSAMLAESATVVLGAVGG